MEEKGEARSARGIGKLPGNLFVSRFEPLLSDHCVPFHVFFFSRFLATRAAPRRRPKKEIIANSAERGEKRKEKLCD